MMQMAAGMADGSGWLQTMLAAAQQGTGGKQPNAYQQRKADIAAKGEAYTELVDKLEVARDNPDDEEAKTAAVRASENYRKMVGTDDMGTRQFQRAYKAAGYTDETMPDWAKPYHDPKSGKDGRGTADERREGERKRIISDYTTNAAKESDPAKQYKIRMDGVTKVYDNVKRDVKVSDAVAEQAVPQDIEDSKVRSLYKGVISEIMRKNNVTSDQAVSFIDSVRSGGKPKITDQGTVQVPGLDRDIFVNNNIFEAIVKLPRIAAKV
jgi:hypothetical protein